MKLLKILTVLLMLFIVHTTFSQNDNRWRLSKEQAKSILNTSLQDSTAHNLIGKAPLLTGEKNAVEFAENVLFQIYGRSSIQKQKPYNVFNIDGYWIISGTLPKNLKGGTFLIIIDSRNYRIIRITHGK